MNEFDNIKLRMKTAIMLEPTISLKIQQDYCKMLEECNSMKQVPNELRRFVKIVLTEMKEEQEEIEESKNEMKDLKSIDEIISSIDKTINDIQNNSEKGIEENREQNENLFDYIDENGKVKLTNNFESKIKKYDWKRELRSALASLIITLNDENYNTIYVKDEYNNDILLYLKNIKKLQDVFEKYNLYMELDSDKEKKAEYYLEQRLLELSQENLMLCLSYILQKEKTAKEIINKYLDNRILVGLATLLYNHLYNLI